MAADVVIETYPGKNETIHSVRVKTFVNKLVRPTHEGRFSEEKDFGILEL